MDINALLFRRLVYYPVVWLRGQRVPHYLKQLLETQYLPPAEGTSRQLDKLKRMVEYAAGNVPYYRERLRHLDVASLSTLDDLQNLPCTTKSDLKDRGREFQSGQSFPFVTRKTTGGSTGEPVTILKTRDAMAWELAATWRGYSWAGISIGDRQGRFWGVPASAKDRTRAAIIDFIAHRRRCSAFAFNESDLRRYTEVLRAFRPSYFYGYVSMLEEYAKFFARTGATPPFGLKCVITTSEVLTQHQKQLIEGVFSTRVFNEYGSGELGSVAHECEEGSLHLSAENMVVEILDGERRCRPGEVGELVVTELNNLAYPLIRYRTGDFAALAARPCKCGRTLPVIENLYGRAYDTIRNCEGRLFHGEFIMYIFEEAQRRDLGVRAFQVVQETLHSFTVRIVPDDKYGSHTEKFITERIRNGFDQHTHVAFKQVTHIPRAPSGKMRLIVGMGG
jgi:phenylacetate-CoA ligase